MFNLKYSMSYTIEDIFNIGKTDIQDDIISEEIYKIILNITNQVSSPDYIKTPNFKKKNSGLGNGA